MSERGKFVLRDGELVKKDGPVAPWLPPEHMRELPEDYYTQNTSDPDRIHELDAPHVVESLTADRQKAEQEGQPEDAINDWLKKQETAPIGVGAALDQFNIDVQRMRVVWNLITDSFQRNETHKLKTHYLWYPENNLDIVHLRAGNPPADEDRPKHLRGFRLEVDPFGWPERFRERLAQKGIEMPTRAEFVAQFGDF